MGVVNFKNMVLILFAFVLISCESIVSHKGVVMNIQKQPIENVAILVQINDKIRESYGIEVPDTIPYQKRDSINTSKGLEKKKYLINDKGQYVQFKPYTTDSTGQFEFALNESSVFGQPSYKLIFRKEGYEDYEFVGDWKSTDNLEIILKEID